MLKIAVTLLLFSFVFQSATAGSGDLEIKLLNNNRKEMVAGFTSNVLVMLINHSDNTKQVKLKLNTEGNTWKQIADYSVAQIEKNSELNKIISIHIPDNTRAGDYSIELEAFENQEEQSFGKVSIPIYVKPRYEITVDKQKAPGYLVSGDSTHVKFLIRNLSNLDIAVNASITNGKKLENRNFRIPMDSSILANVSVLAPNDISYNSKLNITLTANIKEKTEIESSESYLFDIIPSGNVKFDGYNRFPVRVSGIVATSNRMDKRDFGTMFDIRGGGLISETKNRKLEFHLRGPDRGGNPILGLNDEYSVTFSTPRIEIFLGDNNYRLSDLTESSRSGRGGELRYKMGKMTVGTFFHIPRYYPGVKQIFSIYTNYNINQKMRFSAGYLGKFKPDGNINHLLTISGFINPFSWGNAEFELAAGQQPDQMAKAYKVTININKSILASHLSFTQADPGFSGYFSNSSYLSSGITANLKKKVSVSLNYDINRSNLSLDTIYSNAPYSKNLNLMTTYRMNSNKSVSIGAYITSNEDRATTPLFNYKKFNGRISLQSRYKKMDINLYAELGKSINLLGTKDGELTDFYNGNLSLKYTFNKSVSATGFINYQGGKQYLITGFQRFYYGGSLQASLKKKTYISFDYRNNYVLKEYYRDRSLLSLQLHQQFFSNHEFDLGINYNLVKNSLNKKELSIQVRYTYTINIPLSKKKNVGSLKGKVISIGIDQIEGIMFNLNGNIAVTDKNGNFEFPVVKVGTYILTMNESSAGLNAIAGVSGPYRVTIEPGRETQFEISLTRSARITGRLVIREDEKSGRKGFYPVKEEIENLIIEASNGTDIYRELTGRNGTFSFDDLRPGNWNIKVYSNGIPQGYQLDKDQFSLNIPQGKEVSLDVIIHKKSREIKIQKKF
ncbi:MAG: hypothetical protein AB9833_03610 [Bacteroidales bacterium]